ncbi:TadE/TadG family type IV pilus assembly protein [Promicromonospora iranensis]|uniref:Flp pilus assembly protein TadG n=1 Tax=Promicromonospora iranensis TaxID=1105144 RepID=A0ABU2CIR6_9MICO|nr:TadE/TadG family type IV pilus assembly protein [Promicromonospora iranensis]MDR7381231.1 Flp pilus assembly protein TadG [Promicromonospora iranensis]
MTTSAVRIPDQPRTPVRRAHTLAPVRVLTAAEARTPWCAGRGREEAGQAAIQTAILLPLVILLIIAAVQATLWFAGRQVAIAAASEGARVAAAESGTAGSGQTAAVQFASTTGRGFLLAPRATVTRTATTATVTLTGSTQSLVAGWDLTITQSASMPVERLTAPGMP